MGKAFSMDGFKKFDLWTEEECDDVLDLSRTPLTLAEKRFVAASRFVLGWGFGRVCLDVVGSKYNLMTMNLTDKPERE